MAPKPHLLVIPFAALAVGGGCQDYLFKGRDTGTAPFQDADTAHAPDTSADTVDIDADSVPVDTSVKTCPDSWPDRAVAVDDTCAAVPVDWNLHELWEYDDELSMVTAHAGRFDDTDGDGVITRGDAMSLWGCPYSLYRAPGSAVLVDGATGTLDRRDATYDNNYRMYARTADFDSSRLGMEIASPTDVRGSGAFLASADEASTYAWNFYADDVIGVPWFVDMDGDGAPEVVVGHLVLDPTDGRILRDLDPGTYSIHTVAADLDGDGLPELVSITSGGVGIWPGTGGNPAICPLGHLDIAQFAIGNLDGDADGEIVVAGDHVLAICEADGTLDASIARSSVGGATVGIGELDGDPEPEIVIDDNTNDGTTQTAAIVAYDTDLTELWRHPEDMSGGAWNPFTLSDLDGDGRHEIIVREHYALTILDSTGDLLATAPTGFGNNHWKNGPLVVDVDGDDLAEIVVSGSDPTMQVFENDAGGWLIDEAGVPSPGMDQHPGILNEDGTVPSPAERFWTDPARNVWQGHAIGTPDRPNLAVTIDDVCAESCTRADAAYVVTVYVENLGATDVLEPIGVDLQRASDGVVVGSAVVAAGLPSGVARAVEVRVPVTDAIGGLRASVDPGAAILECDELDNTADWTDLPCP